MKKAVSELERLDKAARLLLLDVAIGQGNRSGTDADAADKEAWAALDEHRFIESFFVERREEWGGRRTGRRSGVVTAQARNWLQAVLESGDWRLTDTDERGRWEVALAALRKGDEIWTRPVPEVLAPGAEWGQTALDNAEADAAVVKAVEALFTTGGSASAALERLVAAAPPLWGPSSAETVRLAWLERADEVCRAWGKALFGRGKPQPEQGAWLPDQSSSSCPVVDRRPGTWQPGGPDGGIELESRPAYTRARGVGV